MRYRNSLTSIFDSHRWKWLERGNELMKWTIVLLIAACMTGCSWFINEMGGGHSDGDPDWMQSELSDKASKLVKKAYEDIGEHTIVDHHVHIVGTGKPTSEPTNGMCPDVDALPEGIYLNENRFDASKEHSSLLLRLKTQVMMSTAKIQDPEKGDEQAIRRLYQLVKNIPGKTKVFIMALDGYWGSPNSSSFNKTLTDIYVPNEYVIQLADCLNDKLKKDGAKSEFQAVISVHPYRKGAIGLLRKYAEDGYKYIKWLPNVMNIDPERVSQEYYDTVATEGMVLMSHTGYEEATHVEPDENQRFGAPFLLKKALNTDVEGKKPKVIMAHSGGDCSLSTGGVDSFQQFETMMSDPAYIGQLYGDISALTIKKNFGHMQTLIERLSEDSGRPYQGRILYGSDYPLPATYALYPVDQLITKGYLELGLREPLKEIFKYNPLVFDYVLKRNIRHPKTKKYFPKRVFFALDDNGEAY